MLNEINCNEDDFTNFNTNPFHKRFKHGTGTSFPDGVYYHAGGDKRLRAFNQSRDVC